MVYVILGMHKSGTTLVTEMLHQSGINMGNFDSALTYDQNNKSERHETQNLNRDFLHGLLIPPTDYLLRRPFRPDVDRAGYRRNKDSIAIIRVKALDQRIKTAQPPRTWRETAVELDQKFEEWGFKDPRTCLTYPIWEQILPSHKIIVVYRHYNQLIQRYKVKRWDIFKLFRVLHGWTIYNQKILQAARHSSYPTLFINYEQLMTAQSEFERLCHFVGRPLIDMRKPQLYRNRAVNREGFASLIRLLTPLLTVHPDALYSRLEKARSRFEQGA
ncbi:MAG: sulfotransferase [Ardenticatenaceae bacterium]|nr:sulfotransferase [Ardenticatenaceae bacterium]